jgi:tagatose 6-phosphate kinase
MILTVTINPLLERRLSFKEICLGCQNREGEEQLKAGGKGINVNRQLNRLGIQNFAFTFLGGNNGKLLKEVLSGESINFAFVKTTSETRDAVLILDKSRNSLTSYFRVNTEVIKSEVDEFKIKLEKMIQNCEIVIFSGSSPDPNADSIFPSGIEMARKYDKISVCDTYGNHLKDCIESGPTIIHNNIEEIEKSLNISLVSEKEKLDYLDFLYTKNVKQSYLTDGANDFYCSNFDFHFKVRSSKVDSLDSTGSGDCFVAGIAYAWHNSMSFESSLKLAASLGIANSLTFDTSNVSLIDAQPFSDSIIIEPIGKLMKSLDVAPR